MFKICSKTVMNNFSKVYVNRRTNIWCPSAARYPEGHGFSASVTRPETNVLVLPPSIRCAQSYLFVWQLKCFLFVLRGVLAPKIYNVFVRLVDLDFVQTVLR